MGTRIIYLHIALLFLICGSGNVVYAEPFKGPWEGPGPSPHPSEQEHKAFNPFGVLVQFHREYLSPIDGKECPMYPSCSEYSLLCLKKHGTFVGWMMSCDRLLHEANEMRQAPLIYVNGEARFHDPVENNDFWWHRER
jgi:putative component of membrane protein insertase Oxa1/YidC/SpoIIIJ protein YidD